jgi:5-methylcytosine-specific restriction endonuclease McrA
MPLIANEIPFSPEDVTQIKAKTTSPGFSHADWGGDDLMHLRCKIREFYRSEQTGICAYCKKGISLVSAANAQVEHIAPKSLHPQFIFEPKNLCVICADCNEIKRSQETLNEVPDTVMRAIAQYPRSSSAFKIVHPFFDEYDEHILVFGRYYLDLTDKGHFTIGACKLNRYLREFGVDDDFVDDDVIIEVMRAFMEEKSSVRRTQVLRRLRDMIIYV